MAVKYPLKFYSDGSVSCLRMTLAYFSFLIGAQLVLSANQESIVLNSIGQDRES